MSIAKPVDAVPSYTSAELNLISGAVSRRLRDQGVRIGIAQIRAVIEEAWPYVVTPALADHQPKQMGDETICEWCGTRWPCETATGAGVV